MEEGAEQLKLLLKHPDYRKDMNLLRDCSLVALPKEYDLDWFNKTSKEVLGQADEDLGTRRKVAWVVSNAQDFKTIHQWSVVERLNIKVSERHPFRDVRRAMTWLGLPEDYKITFPE